VLFRLRLGGGELLAAVLLGTLTVTATVAWGWLGISLLRTSTLFDAWAFGGGIFLAAIGGAIVPTDLLPDVVRRLGPASPIHWSVRGFRTVFLDGGGVADVTRPLLVLAAFTAGFTLLALATFDAGRPKIGRLQ
jgi:ABC-2 type transport system permease protein